MTARIFKPAKTTMQSGNAKTDKWVLEFDDSESLKIDPLMGWTGSNNMQSQVRLSFRSKQDAIAYAEKKGLIYNVNENQSRKFVVRENGYGDNFASNRKMSWTH